MDEDFSSSSDSLRTNWTPPMDCYFVKLLLDQVHRGNKTGNAFSKEGWSEMIACFNDKFGFRHDIDVLKNRYKQLRKKYNDVRVLTQSGFSWDDSQKMVTADDHVWDDYIKAHPDMQTYRTKVVPYFRELCIICGHAIADGRYSLSCFDVHYDGEAKGLDDQGHQTPARDDRPKIEWSETMDQHFIKLMLEQVHKGNKIGRTFKKKAWLHMMTEFNKKLGSQYRKAVLQNRYNILRKQHNSTRFLLGQRGFSWDDKQQMVAADDHVWNKVIKECRSFRRCRSKSLPYYVDMCVVCGNETLSFTNVTPVKMAGGFPDPIVNKEPIGETHKEPLDDDDKNLSNQRKRPQPEMVQCFHHQSKKVPRVNKGVEDAMREMEVAVTTLTKRKVNVNNFSIKDVIDTLQAMPDIDEDLLLDACDFLEDERKARMFLALDGTLRKKWLMRKLRPE